MNQRFYSLDVFRGATVALMILVNNPGSWGHIYDPLEHARWHGCTPTDLVFPFFLFAVGNAMAFVIPRLKAAGDAVFWRKVVKRSLLIFFIGVFLNWFPFIKYNEAGNLVAKPYENLRILGVLQRIAICYFFASIAVYYLKLRGALILSVILLLAYWIITVSINPIDPYSLQNWFGTEYVDLKILGANHMYRGEGVPFDPEGLGSILAAIVQVILGYLAGNHIVTRGKTPSMVNGLFVAGCLLVFLGFAWDMVMPINKKIWTSSYTVYTTGLALLVLSVLIYFIEFKNARGAWSRFFDVFGKNALFIFALSGLLPRALALIRIPNGTNDSGKALFTTPLNWMYLHLFKPLFEDQRNASLLYALFFISFMWFLAWLLDKKKIYIKV
jgi:predicted acyltransferase